MSCSLKKGTFKEQRSVFSKFLTRTFRKIFDKASLTRGYALIELETGSAAATAFLGNLSVETPSKLTKPGRGGEPPVVFVFFSAASDAFLGGAKTVQAALENVLEALALARRDAKVPVTSSSSVVIRFPGGWGHNPIGC